MRKLFNLFIITFALTTFANATELTAWDRDGTTWVTIKDKPNNYEDWIGIYPKNSSNSWSNVIAWKWARNGSASPDEPNTDEYRFNGIDYGEYEARFFLNNTFKTEYKSAFKVFDPYKPSINLTTTTLKPNKAIEFNLGGYPALSGNQDWVGIYPKGASNDWNNVLSWSWAKKRNVTLTGVPVGSYEARLFFNNSYTIEASISFDIEADKTATISLDNGVVKPQENISFTLSNLSGDRDWIGIYPKGASNDWNNVITWGWAKNTKVTLGGVSVGEYETRLFFNNSYILEASVPFSIENKNVEFWKKGALTIAPVIEVGNNGLVYYPKNLHGKKAPVVFVVKNHSSPRKKLATLINFIASHGFYVVLIDPSVAGSNYYTEPKTKIAPRYIEIVNYLNERGHNLDTSTIGVVGSSYSGGNTFPVLHRLKEEGYGSNASFLLAIESANAFQMSKADMRSLSTNNTYITLLEYDTKGNLRPQENGKPNPYSTDALFPLINYLHLKSANNLENIDFQVFEDVGTRGHLYHQDTSIINGNPGENYQHMKGVLNPLGALMQLVINKNNQVAREVALNKGSDSPVKDGIMKINPISSYSYDCKSHDDKYIRGYTNIKYFNADALKGNRDYINSIEDLNF